MRCIVLFLLAALTLPAVFADDGKEVKAEVTYAGQGVFVFRKLPYTYDDLVTAIQAAHPDEHVDLVVVDMGSVAGELDKAKVCSLRAALKTRVKMHITVGDEQRDLFCN